MRGTRARRRAVCGRRGAGYPGAAATEETGRPPAPGADRTAARAPPLVERERELATLAGTVDVARDGSGRLVHVAGEAGAGKTRLLAEAATLAADRGMVHLGARGTELERGFPFGVMRRLFGPCIAQLEAQEMEALLDGAAAPAADLLRGVPPAGPPPPDALMAIANAFYLICTRLSAKDPLLLAVDDLHWADGPSTDALTYLVARLDELPIALVVAIRSGEELAGSDPRQGLGESAELTEVVMRALSKRGCARLLTTLLGTVDPAFSAAAHRATGGNPFLLRELALTVAREGIEPDRAGVGWVGEVVPDAIRSWAVRRLGRLDEASRALARSLAVLEVADRRLAAAHARLGDPEALDASDRLAAAGLIDSELPLRFVHPLVRAAVHVGLPPATRDEGHRRAAELLRDRDAPAESIASHLLEAEPRGEPWAVEALRAAGRDAALRGAHEQAVRLLARALEERSGGPDPALELELGRAKFAAGDPGAIGHLETAVATARDSVARAEALGALGHARYVGGQPGEAIEAVRQALDAITPGDGGLVEAELLTSFGLAARTIPALIDELDGRLAAPRLRPDGEPSTAEVVRRQLRGLDAFLRGDREAALEAVRYAAPPLIDEAIFGELPIFLSTSPPFVLAGLGEHAEADPLLERVLDRTRRRGSRLETAEVLEARTWSRWRRGDVRGTLADAELLLSLSEGWWPTAKVPTLGASAVMFAERDDLPAAEAALALPQEVLDRLPGTWGWVWLPYCRAQVELARGDWERALAEALACGERAEAIRATSPEYLDWRSLAARAAAHVGDRDRALELAHEQLALGRAMGSPRATGLALAALGSIGRGAEAIAELEEAAAALQEAGDELGAAHARVERGIALRRLRRPREARDPLREALDDAHRLGSTRLARIALSELRAAGGRPRRERSSGGEALTPRELEIASLAAEGLGNVEIAERLFISRKTVEGHLRTIFRKLEISSREDVAAALRG